MIKFWLTATPRVREKMFLQLAVIISTCSMILTALPGIKLAQGRVIGINM